MITASLLAMFSQPEPIGMNPVSMLWLLPLVASISIVYKATKIPTIKFVSYVKEVIVLFGTLIIFMIITAAVLYAIAWFFLE